MSLNALGYLRKVTRRIVPSILEACRDDCIVQRDTILAARRFRHVDPAVLPELFAALRHPSVQVSYVAAQLLGELGASKQAVEDKGLRAAIAQALAEVLGDPNSDREVYALATGDNWDSSGRLSEALYESLARAMGAV